MLGKSMLLISGVILSLSLISCKTLQSEPDEPNVALGPLIRADKLEDSYVYMTLLDGTPNWERRVYLKDIKVDEKDPKQQLVCTTLNNQTAWLAYEREKSLWIKSHCSN